MEIKKTTAGIRLILYVASFLVLAVGSSLYFLPEKTDVYFSWTINPPLTALVLGSGYLASFVLEFLSAREHIWARARLAVPGVLTFTILTSIVTLVHLDRFHFDSPAWITVAGTWVWLGVYIIVPIALGMLWVIQMRQPGGEPSRENTLPLWMRINLILQASIMLLLGVVMLLAPDSVIPLWPWKLSALTSRAIGAWSVSIGLIAFQALWENDWSRMYPSMLTYLILGTLQIIGLFRYPDVLDWSRFSSLAYVVFTLGIVLTGILGMWNTWAFRKVD